MTPMRGFGSALAATLWKGSEKTGWRSHVSLSSDLPSKPKARAGGQDAGSVPSDSLKLNTPQRASYFLEMNSSLWWGRLNASSLFPIPPRQPLPGPLCHVDANPLQQLFVFFFFLSFFPPSENDLCGQTSAKWVTWRWSAIERPTYRAAAEKGSRPDLELLFSTFFHF